jgi:hypothetical protein
VAPPPGAPVSAPGPSSPHQPNWAPGFTFAGSNDCGTCGNFLGFKNFFASSATHPRTRAPKFLFAGLSSIAPACLLTAIGGCVPVPVAVVPLARVPRTKLPPDELQNLLIIIGLVDPIAEALDLAADAALAADGADAGAIGDAGAGAVSRGAPEELPALSAGPPGSVIGNALDPHEIAQAEEVVSLRGGTFVGNTVKSAPGIDGTLDGVPVSLKTYSGSSPAGILRSASVAERQAANAGYSSVELFIDAPKVDTSRLLDFSQNSPLNDIPNQGVINSIYVRTAGGWVVYPG